MTTHKEYLLQAYNISYFTFVITDYHYILPFRSNFYPRANLENPPSPSSPLAKFRETPYIWAN